jgi:hypothetical protein
MNKDAKFQFIQQWQTVDNDPTRNWGFSWSSSPIQFAPGAGTGIVLAGNAQTPGASQSQMYGTTIPTNVLILFPDQNGNIVDITKKLISDTKVKGVYLVIIYDFNNDGLPDIFLEFSHEFPLVPGSSTAYISQSNGTYEKINIGDYVLSSPFLCFFNNIPTIVTSGGIGDGAPYYQYNSLTKNFDIKFWGNTYNGNIYGSCALLGDFLSNGQQELVIGDFKNGPGYNFDVNTTPTKLVIYQLNGSSLASQPSFIASLYFDQPKYQALYQGLKFGTTYSGISHNYGVLTDDFNHDGKLDILAKISNYGFSGNDGSLSKTKLQMFQNLGDLQFKDVTDILGQAVDEDGDPIDYSMQVIDVDHSGINSYLCAGQPWNPMTSQQSNYILLNDGTGKLYAALHNEFQTWASQLKSQYPNLANYGITSFTAYQTSNGLINFIAINAECDIYNFPLQYDVTSDFRKDVVILDRNNSLLMRTWAGNDIIYDTNANTKSAHIDGGLGYNTAVYSDKSSSYVLSLQNGSLEVKHIRLNSAPNVDDNLVKIQTIKFSDLIIDATSLIKTASLSSTQIASLVELYIASFNRAPDSIGLNYWGSRLSDGMGLQDIAQSFFDQPETIVAYPSTMSTTAFVTKVYNNVLNRAPDTPGLNYWIGELGNGHISKNSFLLAIINGALAPTGSAIDKQTLTNKELVGAHYAIAQGLNNSTNWAKDVMSGVNELDSSVTSANIKTDAYALIASNPATSDLIVKLVGVAV